MFVTGNNDQDKKESLPWQFHESTRQELEKRIEKSQAGEHTGEATGAHTIDSMNLQALGSRLAHDCGRTV